MAKIAPDRTPDISREDIRAFLQDAGIEEPSTPYLVGRRGYYRDTMGARGKNDIGIYDDAICIVTDRKVFAFNANTDPSRLHPGMAVLAPGVWLYREGIHGITRPKERQYPALVQAGPVTLNRHAAGRDTGWFGINIHRGGVNGTSSEGCQTITPGQWPTFMATFRAASAASGKLVMPYVLTVRADA